MAEKIMVVDDEKDIVFLLRDYFTFNDYEVITAYNVQQATEKLGEKPDLILLDINMPCENGLDFCKQIRNQTDCPIIFLTARADETDVLAGLNVGGDDYITHPIAVCEIVKAQGYDEDCQIAALFHDLLEDTDATEAEILDAIHRPLGAKSVDAVKRRVRAGMGRCQGGFCQTRVAELIANELQIPFEQVTKKGNKSFLMVGKTK